jgi:hypothetical protein
LLLDSCNKGPPKKKKQEDREVNVGDRGNRMQQPAEQKEKIPFHQPADDEKRCEIHRIIGHYLKECRTFLDRKKMPEKLVV